LLPVRDYQRSSLVTRGRLQVVAAALCAAGVLSAAAPTWMNSAEKSAVARSTDSPVADAAMRGDTAKLRSLLKQGGDANAAQADGMTALHWAAARGDAQSVRTLVFAGARLEAATRNGNYTPLHLAAQAGRGATVRALLEAGANPNAATNTGGATPLHMAAAQGDLEAVTALLEFKATVDARDAATSETPLMWAANYNRVPAIEALLAHGADIEAVSLVENMSKREKADRESNALRTRKVVALKNAETAPVLPAAGAPRGAAAGTPAGASAAKVTATTAATATAAATAKKDDKKSDKKDGKKEDKQAKNSDEAKKVTVSLAEPKTAKDSVLAAAAPKAVAAGETGPVIGGTQLSQPAGGNKPAGLSYGDLIGNKGGLTPLLFAVRQGNTESVKALLKAGAKINHVSAGDHTSPLLMATINGQFDLAKLLLMEDKADPKLASDAGTTPLYAVINVQWAAKSLYPQPTSQYQQTTTYLDLMEDLLKAGADVNARLTKHLWYMSYNFDLLGINTAGATPFWRAAYGTDVPAMKLLIKYHADPNIPTTKPAGPERDPDGAIIPEGAVGTLDPSGLPQIPAGGPGVYPLQAASGVGYGDGFAANAHRHAPDGWLPSVKYLIEELHADPNLRDYKGYNALHNAAARGDTVMAAYLVSKGTDIKALSRSGQTVADMANGPVQRVPPFSEAVVFLEKLGSKNSNKCKSC
jgi:ankyrin repeat protein